mmetsp:Transcript_15489/g.22853  ORF Transcript_15489/g.22853 Transcript_15489/m.22853 type:complete len:231 (+) Transcript_15489:244-936(+)
MTGIFNACVTFRTIFTYCLVAGFKSRCIWIRGKPWMRKFFKNSSRDFAMLSAETSCTITRVKDIIISPFLHTFSIIATKHTNVHIRIIISITNINTFMFTIGSGINLSTVGVTRRQTIANIRLRRIWLFYVDTGSTVVAIMLRIFVFFTAASFIWGIAGGTKKSIGTLTMLIIDTEIGSCYSKIFRQFGYCWITITKGTYATIFAIQHTHIVNRFILIFVFDDVLLKIRD